MIVILLFGATFASDNSLKQMSSFYTSTQAAAYSVMNIKRRKYDDERFGEFSETANLKIVQDQVDHNERLE
jgi:hypothetical protein